jgi:hypothetical protein
MAKFAWINLTSPGETLSVLETHFLTIFLVTFFRMRAQAIVESPPKITIQETNGQMIPLMDKEIEHCAAVIVAAFLNPCKLNYDWNWKLF